MLQVMDRVTWVFDNWVGIFNVSEARSHRDAFGLVS